MSMEKQEEIVEKVNIYRELELSEQQIIEERTKDARDSLKAMRIKYSV